MSYRRVRGLLREKGALLLVPDVAELVAGERVRGSWWSHPKGKAIFRMASQLEDDPEVLSAKLIDGKVTFVDAGLWPALLRVVTDRRWRKTRSLALEEGANKLLARVTKAKRVVVDDPEDAKAKKQLEPSLLVRTTQEHSATGKHVTVLQSWRAWATPELLEQAAGLSLEEAHVALRTVGISL